MEDVGFSLFVASDNFNCLALFRCQRKGSIARKGRQDIRRPGWPLAPAGQACRTETAHEVAAVALALPIGNGPFPLLFQGLEQFLLAPPAVEDVFVIIVDEGKPVFHLVGNLVLVISPAGQDLAGQGRFDEVPAEAADKAALFTAPLVGDIGLELPPFRIHRRSRADGQEFLADQALLVDHEQAQGFGKVADIVVADPDGRADHFFLEAGLRRKQAFDGLQREIGRFVQLFMEGDDDALFPAMTKGHEDAAADADGQTIGNGIGKSLLQPFRRRIDDDFSNQKDTSFVWGCRTKKLQTANSTPKKRLS